MTPGAAATLVWLAHEPLDSAQSREISAWARTRALALSPPDAERPTGLPVDESVAAVVEDLIERARDGIAARDASVVDGALREADETLRAHAELPNAAWLMAEVERVRSTRLRIVPPTDVLAAEQAWVRAESLDAGRQPGAGEQASTLSPQGATLTLTFPPTTPGAAVWLDGALAPQGAFHVLAGEHAVILTIHGAPSWAGWVGVKSGAITVSLPGATPTPCAVDDFAGVGAKAGAVDQTSSVRCPRWVAATAGLSPGAVRIADCEASHCGALLDWRSPPPWTRAPQPPRQVESRGLPSWAVWAAIGVGAAATAGLAAAVDAGAFKGSSGETRFVNGGLKTPP